MKELNALRALAQRLAETGSDQDADDLLEALQETRSGYYNASEEKLA